MIENNASLAVHPSHRARGAGGWLTAMALALATAVGGCDDGRAAADATLAQARRDLAALNVGGTNPPSDRARAAVYAKVLREVQPITTAGLPAQQTAAKRLVAIVQEGEGQLDFDRAAALAREAVDTMLAAQAILDRRQGQLALADALVAFDPSAEREALRADDAARQKELGEAEATRASLEKELAALRKEAEAHRAEAKALREQEGAARARALDAPADERLAIVEEAVGIQRRADGADREASLALAQVDRKAPEVEAAKSEVARLAKQRDFIALALKQLDARAAVGTEQAAENRGQAEEAARQLATMIAQIDEQMKGPVAQEYGRAVQSLESAERSQRAAPGQGVERTSTQLALGRIRQTMADVERARAYAWGTFGALLTRAVDVKPPLPSSAEYRAMADAALATAREAIAAAAESFGQAAEGFASAGGGAEMAERLQRTADKLKAIQAGLAGAAQPPGGAPRGGEGAGDPPPEQAGGV